MVDRQEIQEIAHKITQEQLAEALRIESGNKELNPDKKSPFKTLGELYAFNYLKMVATSPERKGFTRPAEYKSSESLGVVCPECGGKKSTQYTRGKPYYYWECKSCKHRFRTSKKR